MVLTILTAKVKENSWELLQKTYYDTIRNGVPKEIKLTCLVQEKSNKSIWKILTFWESQAALDTMRESGETPTGVVIFGGVGAKPTLEIFDVSTNSLPQF